VQDITSELGVEAMLQQLLPNLASALGTTYLAVDIVDAEVHVEVAGTPFVERPRSVLAGTGVSSADDWTDAEWRLPLTVRGRTLGQMTARLVLPPGAKADEEQLLNIVANQVAIVVENARLYDGVLRRAAEQQSLVEAGHLLASTLKVDEVLQRFTELVRTRLRVDVVRIWLHKEGTEYRLAAQAGLAEKPGQARMQFAPGEGAVGRIMEHLTPLMLPDLLVDPRFRERAWAQSEGLLSFVGVPLMLDDVPIGVLLCWTRQRREFTSDDVTLAQALATSAAVGIRNARLHEETQLRLRHTETLVAVSQALSATLDLTEVLRRATREMVRALGGDTGVAWLLAPDRTHFVPLVGYHIPKDVLNTPVAASLHIDDPVIRALRDAKGPIAAADSQNQMWSSMPAAQAVAHKSMLIQPIYWKEELIGGFSVLWLRNSHQFTPDELRLAEGIALQGALAVDNSRLYQGV
jgi:GAF domain-containing protein